MKRRFSVSIYVLIQVITLMMVTMIMWINEGEHSLYFYSWLAVFVSIVLFLTMLKTVRTIISPILLFFCSFCAFHMGQFYLYALNVDYNYFFENELYMLYVNGNEALLIVMKYSIMAICVLAIGLTYTYTKNNLYLAAIDSVEPVANNIDARQKSVYKKVGWILFAVSCPLTIVYVATEVYLVRVYGYSGLRSDVGQSVLSNINFAGKMAQFFVPSILLLRLTRKSERGKRIFEIILLVYSVFYFYIGQRTICLALFLVIYIIKETDRKEEVNILKRILLGVLLIVALAFLSNLSGVLRGGAGGFGFSGFWGIFVDFLGECGWSAYPFAIIASLCPNQKGFTCGLSYLAALIGLVPASIDPTGTITKIMYYGNEYWITEYLGFDFGVGYSLSGESYYNFGWFGLAAVFVIAVILGKTIGKFNMKQFAVQNMFGKYIQLIMTFELLTLPRRGMYTFFNAFSYDVIVVVILGIIFSGGKITRFKCVTGMP